MKRQALGLSIARCPSTPSRQVHCRQDALHYLGVHCSRLQEEVPVDRKGRLEQKGRQQRAEEQVRVERGEETERVPQVPAVEVQVVWDAILGEMGERWSKAVGERWARWERCGKAVASG